MLEIDGASNNKVDEVRDLRQNVGFRPTRSRYKIYIIDEVHMLSTAGVQRAAEDAGGAAAARQVHLRDDRSAEDPDHDPVALPAVRLRPRRPGQDLRTAQADRRARRATRPTTTRCKLIARRAGGSMRDSQSLLDQLLASSTGQAHRRAGQRGARHRRRRPRHRTRRPRSSTATPKTALDLIAAWVERGLQIGELVDQLVDYWRALMLVNCGGPDVRELPVTPSQKEVVVKHAEATEPRRDPRGAGRLTATKGRMRDSAARAGAARDGRRPALPGWTSCSRSANWRSC